MSRRRLGSAATDDSLELLLDTICNVFGGITLMAILVILQIQVGVKDLPHEETAPELELERRQLDFEVEQLRTQVADQEQRKQDLAQTLASESSVLAKELVQRRAKFQQALDLTEQARAESKSLLHTLRDKKAELEAERESLSGQRDELERELAKSQRSLGTVRRRARENVRLPLRHDAAAPMQFSILVEGDRIYPLESNCDSTPLEGGKTLHRPRLGRGLPVPAADRVRGLVGGSSSTYFVSIWVSARSSSFETFQALRKTVTDAGYEYSVSTYDESTGLITVPGRPKAE